MKIAYLFPGYGHQFIGMGKDFYDTSRLVQEHFEQAASCLDINFVNLCFADSHATLARPTNAYPALFLLSAALASLLKEAGIQPDVVAGHGLGIYAAAFVAQSINFPDGLYLTNKWAKFYEPLLPTLTFEMRRITGVSAQDLIAACMKISTEDSWVAPCVANLGLECYALGHAAAFERLIPLLRKVKARIKRSNLLGGPHIALPELEAVLPHFSMYFSKVDGKAPAVKLLHSHSATMVTTVDELRKLLVTWAATPVVWTKVVARCAAMADVLIVPFPAQDFYQKLVAAYPHKKIFMLAKPSDLEIIKQHVMDHQIIMPEGVSQ